MGQLVDSILLHAPRRTPTGESSAHRNDRGVGTTNPDTEVTYTVPETTCSATTVRAAKRRTCEKEIIFGKRFDQMWCLAVVCVVVG